MQDLTHHAVSYTRSLRVAKLIIFKTVLLHALVLHRDMNRHRPCCIVAVVDTDNTPEITLGLAAVELKAKIALTVAFPEGPAERSFKVIKNENWPHTHTHARVPPPHPTLRSQQSTDLPLMSSHWDLLPAELKAKIALTVAFPEGDFLSVHWPWQHTHTRTRATSTPDPT